MFQVLGGGDAREAAGCGAAEFEVRLGEPCPQELAHARCADLHQRADNLELFMQGTVAVEGLELWRRAAHLQAPDGPNDPEAEGVGQREQGHELVQGAFAASFHQEFERLHRHRGIDIGQ